jgi:hypothetical protein
VVRYLRSLRRRYPFNFLDCSRLSSVGGSPRGFYDGVHMTSRTCGLVVKAVLTAYPNAFAPTPALRVPPAASPSPTPSPG